MLGLCGARSGRPFSACAGDSCPTGRPRRRALRNRRIRARQAPTADSQSFPETVPNLRLSDRVVAGVCALLMRPRRLIRCAIVLPTKPGPKGPTQEIIAAIVDMKRRNPTWGCPGSRNRSPWPSRFPSPRMWCGAFSPFGTDLRQTQRGRPGSRSSGMRRTVCGVSTCFDANRPSCARTGCSS